MHLLHCLNFIRQEFNPERYHNSQHAHAHAHVDPTLHRDHCIEAIRQSLMCNADLTPIPSRYYEALGQNYIDTNRPHVCRNWGSIRSWVNERVNGSLEVKAPKPANRNHSVGKGSMSSSSWVGDCFAAFGFVTCLDEKRETWKCDEMSSPGSIDSPRPL
jgi:hypothetical protein